MTPIRRLALIAPLAAVALSGCGINSIPTAEENAKGKWANVQADYQRQQSALNEQRRREREAAEALQRAKEELRLEAERAKLREAYARARYGDVVTVTIEGGVVAINGKHQPYEPVRFDLVRGERKEVEFVQQGRSSSRQRIDVRLTEDGHTFYFDESARDRVALISTGWEAGKLHSALNVQDKRSRSEARGLNITVKFKELPGAPRRQEPRQP